MEYRKLGKSDLEVSAVGFGCWAIGGWMWGTADDNDSIAAVKRALDLGINFFDTADIYGRGHSEEVLGKALGIKRKDVVVATKVGVIWDPGRQFSRNLSRKHILAAVDASLKRLRTDYIDLYQAHWPDENTPVEETVEALLECVETGKVRYIGVSNLSPVQLKEYLKYGPIVSHQPPLNLFQRKIEVELLPLCQKENIGVVAYGPLCKGLLTGKFTADTTFTDMARRNDPMFQGTTFRRNLAIVEKLKEIAATRNKTVGQLAIAWVLAHPAVTVAICGARRASQIEESTGGAGWQLSDEELGEIERILVTTQIES